MTQKTSLSTLTTGADFDFEQFQQEAIEKLRKGQPLMGEDGIVTPLIKQLMEASLSAEMAHHLETNAESSLNRRNGKVESRLNPV